MAAAKKNDKNNLGYLGPEFQYRLTKAFIEDKQFFIGLNSIVDQNMFTEANLRSVIGTMKDLYTSEGLVPDYATIEIHLRQKANNAIDREYAVQTIQKIKETSSEDITSIRDMADKFFRQQNLVKIANQVLKIAADGDLSKYPNCVELMQKALEITYEDDLGINPYDNEEEVLSDEYRITIPTGIDAVDKALEGGLAKGELGIIIGPSSFGKALFNDELVVTPNGMIPIKDIQVNDRVIGKDGKEKRVIGVFPQGKRDIYKVTFDDSTEILCDPEHIWSVRTEENGTFVNMTLNQIMDDEFKHEWYIPLCEPVNFNLNLRDEGCPCDAYNYGVILGFLVANENSHLVRQIIGKDELSIHRYICLSTLETRRNFISGLLKAGGKLYTCDGGEKYPSIESFSFTVRKQIIDIVSSLGGHAFIADKRKVVIDYLPTEWNVKDMPEFNNFNLNITGKRIEKIEYLMEGEATCIKVDADDELFLCNHFNVTHNTSLTTAIACHASTTPAKTNNYEGFKVVQIVFEDRLKQIQRKIYGNISNTEARNLSKPEFKEQVKMAVDTYVGKEMMKRNYRIKKYQSGEVSVQDIKEYLKKLINSGFIPDLVIVDYFECVRLESARATSDTEWTKEGYTMRKFEAMADELNIALWIPSQGTKDSLTAEIVTMDKAGGSFKKIQIGHIILSIARTMEDIQKCLATIAILKNRAGQAGKVFNNVKFNNGTCRISTDEVEEFNSMAEYKQISKEEKIRQQNQTAQAIVDRQTYRRY